MGAVDAALYRVWTVHLGQVILDAQAWSWNINVYLFCFFYEWCA